ncbi:phytanoyl-CoA dioxygenase family protein [Paraglaciecola arctica]|uniref:phytanoyl-CoA dioxygenase family protein n=1 Tax=Paraglaciecola arctica TaxID=1128911 RepID=UPI001C068966|nr:phytanoyl-CoA dioxygenase family protein [Paraglaciecola arctica]MBU3005561.1 phytanoyl-CoA dioxygenase family protein [Paraglaciecola arctica]
MSMNNTAPIIDVDAYHRDGYLLLDIFDQNERDSLLSQIDDILLKEDNSLDGAARFYSSDNQHLGDKIEDYGRKTKHYYFHLLTNPQTMSFQHIFHNHKIMGVIEQILGNQLIINNASLFAAEPGTTYKLGWHRDVIQIPQDEIDEAKIFSKERFHNSVQINLPLYEDNALWVVPGSHHRPNTEQENKAFTGSKHYAPIEADMPGAVQLKIKAGQAALYNNNLIHRGACEMFKEPRRSLHMGYHSATLPPTWHFYLLNEDMFTDDYLEKMSPEVRTMLDEYFICRQQYPRMQDTWNFCD